LLEELFHDKDFKRSGNRILLLKNGDQKFDKLIEDLNNAKHTINLQTFIINDGIVFKKIEKALISKVKEGVKVRVSTDYVGNLQTSDKAYDALKKAGVEFFIFNKLNVPFTSGKANHRNHDKFIVIDNQIAYTGGLNIGDDYAHLYSKYGY
jgi:cardiolipin synthase